MMHRDGGDQEASGCRLQREAQGIAKLIHENVIVVHEVGTHEGRVYLAMEYVAGRTLTRWQVGRSWREILDAYLRAGRGLVAAHDAGLVHRDFKPDNVLVGDDGRLRVTDFGLVATIDAMIDAPSREPAAGSAAASLATRLTASGALLGTPRYMAPEQYRAEPVDARADQFAFCAALYEALYGAPAFAGTTLAEISSAILAGAAQPVPADSDVPHAVRDAILRGLAGDRAARFPHLRDLLATLAGVVAASDPSPRRQHTRVATAAIAGLALVAGLAIWVASKGSSHTDAAIAAPATPGSGSDPLQDARTAFEEGQRAFASGEYASAAAGYLAAYAARPYPQFLFNAAASHQRAANLNPNDPDEYAKAIALYQWYLVSAPADSASVAKTIAMLEAEVARLATRPQSAPSSDEVSRVFAPKPRGAVMIESMPQGATI